MRWIFEIWITLSHVQFAVRQSVGGCFRVLQVQSTDAWLAAAVAVSYSTCGEYGHRAKQKWTPSAAATDAFHLRPKKIRDETERTERHYTRNVFYDCGSNIVSNKSWILDSHQEEDMVKTRPFPS